MLSKTLPIVAIIMAAWIPAAAARGPRSSSKKPEPTRPAYVPSPMAVGRVRVTVRGTQVLVTTDVTIPQARQTLGDMDVHVAYGAPGTPSAFDAQVLATPAGYLVAPVELSGRTLAHEWASHAPAWATLVLGRPQMGGHTIHLTAASLAEAQRATGRATLRIRQVYPLPALLSDGSRELLVRLASMDGRPLAVGLVEFASDEAMRRVEARYCGVEGEGRELFVGGAHGTRGIAPPLAARGWHDDLCLRFGDQVSGQGAKRERSRSGRQEP